MSSKTFDNPVHVEPLPRLDVKAECTDVPSEGLHSLDRSSGKVLTSNSVLALVSWSISCMLESFHPLLLNIADTQAWGRCGLFMLSAMHAGIQVIHPVDLPPVLHPHAYELSCIKLAHNLHLSLYGKPDHGPLLDDGEVTPAAMMPSPPKEILLQFLDQTLQKIVAKALDEDLRAAQSLSFGLKQSPELPSYPSEGETSQNGHPATNSTQESNTINDDDEADSSAPQASSSGSGNPQSAKAKELVALVGRFGETQKELHSEEYRVRPRELRGMIEQRRLAAHRHQAACEWLSEEVWHESMESGTSALPAFVPQVSWLWQSLRTWTLLCFCRRVNANFPVS